MRKVISGGQTGADIAALRAAKKLGIPTGGYLPKDWLTEDGPRPEYEQQYAMRQHPQPGWVARTESNVLGSRATVILTLDGGCMSGGTGKTWSLCRFWNRPVYIQDVAVMSGSVLLAQWLEGFEVVNFAGPRESKRPGIEEQAEKFLIETFAMLLPVNKGEPDAKADLPQCDRVV